MTSSTRDTKPSLVVGKGDVAAKEAVPSADEKAVDAALEESFPASDPPFYMGGAVIGGPKKGTLKPASKDKS
jgi:hypothetical protein